MLASAGEAGAVVEGRFGGCGGGRILVVGYVRRRVAMLLVWNDGGCLGV
jgi:hypothetical protein